MGISRVYTSGFIPQGVHRVGSMVGIPRVVHRVGSMVGIPPWVYMPGTMVGIHHPCYGTHLHTPGTPRTYTAARHPLLPWCTPRPCVGEEALGSVGEKALGERPPSFLKCYSC